MSTSPVVLLRDSSFVVALLEQTVPTVPMSAVAPVGPKGDPGGNIMAIGLFEDADTLTIPVGTDVVRTSGYAIVGQGIADYLADAAVDAAYVTAHPRTSFISANSRGFRLDVSMGVNLFQTGGIADCTGTGLGTDNYPALMAAYNALPIQGGAIGIPHGRFRMASTPVFTKRVLLSGVGYGENPGLVDGVSYGIPLNYYGSMFFFDAEVAGLRFIGYTDNNLSSPAFEFQSSGQSCVRDLMLYGGGGTGITAHGVESRVPIYCENVRVENFAGNGWWFRSPNLSSDPIGSTDFATLIKCHARSNKLHGFYVYGGDSNVMSFIGCDSALNGGCGYLDRGGLGNAYFTCHAATNNKSYGTPAGFSAAQRSEVIATAPELSDAYAGSFFTTSHVSGHVFIGCYAETGLGQKHCVLYPSVIIGGLFSSVDDVVDTVTWFKPLTLNAETARNLDHFVSRGGGFTFDDDIKIDGVRVLTNRQPFLGYPSGGSVIDTQARNSISEIYNILISHGLAG